MPGVFLVVSSPAARGTILDINKQVILQQAHAWGWIVDRRRERGGA